MSKKSEKYAIKIHERALSEGLNYAKTHGHTIEEQVAYGRGFKTGCITGYEQAEQDLKLTADDIGAILMIYFQMMRDEKYRDIGRDAICNEALKRFYELDENE